MKNYDITKTKLIIWDLDDTFWKGNLEEGNVLFDIDIVNFIQELTTKGIMNSICSKNDFQKVKEKFVNSGFEHIWDLFVFPSINFFPKGERVMGIIKDMNLREENVIFIDDNISNLNEALFYCPKIMTATPENVRKMSEELYLVNDYDFEHTRLKQYKLLERKAQARGESSNEEFLRSSGIKICIKTDCLKNIDRIKKLILRTNQLNFTKFRDENLEETIRNNNSAYVIAEDKFGNYGICGFYVTDKVSEKLIHFLFSCRVMNMGIEQYVYSYLGKPDIEKALENTDGKRILITHSPDIYYNVKDSVDLILAGHTHGGQVSFPPFGAPIVPSEFGSKFANRIIKETQNTMIITKGIGTSILPVRFCSVPEIVVIN